MSGQALHQYCDPGADIRRWIDKHIGSRALSSPLSLCATAAFTLKILAEGIPGCLVECGVFTGAHPAVMAHACDLAGEVRDVWLFDSFAGLPETGPEDHNPGTPPFEHGGFKCTLGGVLKNLAEWKIDAGALHFVEGWFSETIPSSRTGPIALLRIDADLHASTEVCAQHLYDRVVPNGFVIVDDWNYDGVREAVDAVVGAPHQLHKIPGGRHSYFWRKDNGGDT